MRLFLILIIFLYNSNIYCQAIKNQLCSHSWQEKTNANILWNFQKSGSFSAMNVLINEKVSVSGLILKKGNYSINDSSKTITISFDSSYTIYSNDSLLIKKDTLIQKWHLIKISHNKIIFDRPPLWEFEKSILTNYKTNIRATIVGGKGRKKRKVN